jgi:ACS family hexuronate transporter-like MFS transporter
MASDTSPRPPTRYRWTICALLFAATTINYMDRSILGVLGPTLQYKVFNWSDTDWANINVAFKAAYAVGLLAMGAIIDRVGTKIGYTLAIAIWSVSGMLHAAVRPAFSVIGFSLARIGLGFGEAGNFPAAIKTVAEWFPKKERALATGIFNAGSNVGAILAPIVIPMVVSTTGHNWQLAFLTTGVFSALWVVLWLKMYRRPSEHPHVSKEEYAYIHSDSVAETKTEKLPWSKVIFVRETWAFAVAKITDAAWWFYLFWGGKFLFDRFGLDIKSLALPLIIIYVIADIGSVGGGWLSSAFIKRGWPINRARKTTLLICALCILPVMFVTRIGTRFNVDDGFFTRFAKENYTVEETDASGHTTKTRHAVEAADVAAMKPLTGKSYGSAKEFLQDVRVTLGNGDAAAGKAREVRLEAALIRASRSDSFYWLAVWLIALAAAAHQAWSANVFTLVSDVFPKKATASVTGIGGTIGALAGLVSDLTLGGILSASGPSAYMWAFFAAGSVYLVTLGIAHLLMPKMTPLDENLQRVRA